MSQDSLVRDSLRIGREEYFSIFRHLLDQIRPLPDETVVTEFIGKEEKQKRETKKEQREKLEELERKAYIPFMKSYLAGMRVIKGIKFTSFWDEEQAKSEAWENVKRKMFGDRAISERTRTDTINEAYENRKRFQAMQKKLREYGPVMLDYIREFQPKEYPVLYIDRFAYGLGLLIGLITYHSNVVFMDNVIINCLHQAITELKKNQNFDEALLQRMLTHIMDKEHLKQSARARFEALARAA